jgi:hypothetical protein
MNTDPHHAIDPRPSPKPEPHHRIIMLVFIVALSGSLPGSAALLVLLHAFDPFHGHPDMAGLTATSIGIIGIIIFYTFLYKFQTTSPWSRRARLAWLSGHLASIIVLFYFIVWLGFASPISGSVLWGDYDLQTTAKSWVISDIVVGTITLLGGLFDLLRRYAIAVRRKPER